MEHQIEPASSGRARCRGCGKNIAKDELRFGENLPNPFADGTVMTHWFHPKCAALKRPDALLETIQNDACGLPEEEAAEFRAIAREGLEHRRLPRIDGGERAPSGRARCRHCGEMIPKDEWRVRLVFYEEGMFNPAGYIHMGCSLEYLGTSDILNRVKHFSQELDENDLAAIDAELKK